MGIFNFEEDNRQENIDLLQENAMFHNVENLVENEEISLDDLEMIEESLSYTASYLTGVDAIKGMFAEMKKAKAEGKSVAKSSIIGQYRGLASKVNTPSDLKHFKRLSKNIYTIFFKKGEISQEINKIISDTEARIKGSVKKEDVDPMSILEEALDESIELLNAYDESETITDEDLEMMYESFEGDEDLLCEDGESLMEAQEIFLEANIVKLDAKTLKRRLLRRCALIVAKEANDPLYHKYVKFAKAKKETRAQIQRKYESPAKRKLKELLARRRNANIAKVGNAVKSIPERIKPQSRS